jgi:hypothetical protein
MRRGRIYRSTKMHVTTDSAHDRGQSSSLPKLADYIIDTSDVPRDLRSLSCSRVAAWDNLKASTRA